MSDKTIKTSMYKDGIDRIREAYFMHDEARKAIHQKLYGLKDYQTYTESFRPFSVGFRSPHALVLTGKPEELLLRRHPPLSTADLKRVERHYSNLLESDIAAVRKALYDRRRRVTQRNDRECYVAELLSH